MEIKGLKNFLELKKSEKKMSVKEFYTFLGLSKGTYYNIIGEESVADAEHLFNFIKLFGQDFKRLIGIDELDSNIIEEPSYKSTNNVDVNRSILEELKKQTLILEQLKTRSDGKDKF